MCLSCRYPSSGTASSHRANPKGSETGAIAKSRTTITSYKTITGTTHTTIRSPGQKPTRCTSYTNITGTTKTNCR